MKKFFPALALSCALLLLLSSGAFAAYFNDIQGHAAQREIEEWVDAGYISGYDDGTFRPNASISRAEFCAIITCAFTLSAPPEPVVFTDVTTNDWFYSAIAASVGAGYLNGYTDNSFRPNEAITREEAAAVLYRLLELQPNVSAASYFADSDLLSWSKEYVGACAQAGVLYAYSDNYFRPQQELTRGEAVTSLYASWQRAEGSSTSYHPGYTPLFATYTFNFYVQDEQGAPLEGATVVINNITRTTNANGLAEFSLNSGSHSYRVSFDGWAVASGTVTVTSTSSVNRQTITLYPADVDNGGGDGDDGDDGDDGSSNETYSLTIVARDSQNNLLPGVQITLTGTSHSGFTDVNGAVVFTGLAPGNYQYVAMLNGNNQNGSVTITNHNANETVTFAVVSYSIFFQGA